MKYLVIAALLGSISGHMLAADSMKHHRRPKRTHDNFDGSPNSVSVYDDGHNIQPMSQQEKDAHAEAKEKYANQSHTASVKSFAQKAHKHRHHKTKGHKDAYDNDVDSASPYDDSSNINGGNPYMKTLKDESVMPGPGL